MIALSQPTASRLLPVTREQAVRLFMEGKVTSVELVDDLAVWTFAGGIVLMLDHTIDPPAFTLALDTTEGVVSDAG